MKRIAAILALLVAAVVTVVVATGADDGGGYKVRAIFDNASFLGPGDVLKVAGVITGTVEAVELTPDNKAAVVISVDDPAFHDFRTDASCIIRPQSLIGERFVECKPTQPHPPDEEPPPELEVIPEGEPGAGQRLLPLDRTTTPVDIDLIGNIYERPYAERFSIILNELGVGLAANGEELRRVVRKLNPALAQTDAVLELLADQNRVLADLARDSDAVLAPLARQRENVADFITEAEETASATAEVRGDLERTLERLPAFLRELNPTLDQLGSLSDALTPTLADLRAVAPDVNRLNENLGPFADAATPALESLGEAARVGRPAVRDVRPDVNLLRQVAVNAEPVGRTLAELLESLKETGTLQNILRYLYFQATAINGFDQFSHYLRAGLIVNAACAPLSAAPVAGCWANFTPDPNAGEGEGGGEEAEEAAKAALRQATEQEAAEHEATVSSGGSRAPDAGDGDRAPEGASEGAGDSGGSGESGGSGKASGGDGAGVQAPRLSPPSGAPADPAAGALDYLLGSEEETP